MESWRILESVRKQEKNWKVCTSERLGAVMSWRVTVIIQNNSVSTIVNCCIFLERGIKYLFPIQAKTFDLIYEGNDVIGKASKLFWISLLQKILSLASLPLSLSLLATYNSYILQFFVTRCFNVPQSNYLNFQWSFPGTGTGKTVSMF